jgi:hypothetical protein
MSTSPLALSPAAATRSAPTPTDHRDRLAAIFVVEMIARCADLRQWHALTALLASEIDVREQQPVRCSRALFIRAWRQQLAGFDTTQHALSDFAVTFTAQRARAEVATRFFATYVRSRPLTTEPVWTLSGQATLDLRRTPSGWQLSGLRLIRA